MKRAIHFMLFIAIACFTVVAGKTTKIKLTGTANERIIMTIGNSGRTEIINSFPYILEVPKDALPLSLSFHSDNYIYYNIDVPKKPFDTTGHVYLVKINESAMAINQNRFESQPQGNNPAITDIPDIDFTHGVNAAPLTGKKNENVFALIISNENYDLAARVDNAINDGSVFKEYCTKTLGLPDQNVRYFKDLTYGKMKKAINDIVEIAGILDGDASVIIYYAGHGIPDNKTKDAFLMPVDADGSDTQVCISLKDLYNNLNASSHKQCVVFLDACFSGAQRDGEMIMAARGVKLKPQAANPQGNTVVFCATSSDEAAYSYKDEKHGLFTYFVLKKLQETKGNVNLGELADYISKNVRLQSRLINNNPQTPSISVSPAVADTWKSLKLYR